MWYAIVLFLASLLGSIAAQAADAWPRRPNFVVLAADAMGRDDSGAYGRLHLKTPNIDRLAKEGMRLDRAMLTCGSSGPSRASMLTGRYPHATGASELHMPLPADQVLLTQPLRAAGYFTAAAGQWHLGPAAKAKFDVVKEGGGPGGYGDWLPLLRDRPKDKRFFLWLAATDPRRPYYANTIREPHRSQDVVVPPYLPDVDEVRVDLARYYDAIARLDQNVGLVLAELERQGLSKTTVVFFLSTSGRPFPRCATALVDSGVQTPLIVRWPGQIKPGTTTASLASAVDLAPTVLELAGLKPLASLQGLSFVPMLRDPQAQIRPYAFFEHNWHDYMAYERGVRSKRFTYIRNAAPQLPATPPADVVRGPTFQAMRQLRDQGRLALVPSACFVTPRPAEELYDTQADPHALKNLVGDPRSGETLKQMRKALADWQRQTGDYQPDPLTPDRYDRESGMGLNAKIGRPKEKKGKK